MSSTPPCPPCPDATGLLALLAVHLPVRRRTVHAGDALYRSGQPLVALHVVSVGLFKSVMGTPDGRNQLVGLHGRGDWLGLDGLDGLRGHRHACDAIALDIGELWSVDPAQLLHAGGLHPPLLVALHSAMGREINRSRDAMLSLCSLPAAARVAAFVLNWATTLAGQGQRTDQLRLRMTRADLGNYLGMTLESVSRALSALERTQVIGFTGPGRRDILIPDLPLLAAVVKAGPAPRRSAAGRLAPPPAAQSTRVRHQPL